MSDGADASHMRGMENISRSAQSPEFIEAVRHILGHHNHPGGYRAGTFTTDLIELWGKADYVNQARLATGFPVLGQVIAILQRDGLEAVAALLIEPKIEKRV